MLYLGAAAVYLINFGIHAMITGAIIVATRHCYHLTSDAGLFIRASSLLFITMIGLIIAHLVEIGVWTGYFRLIGLMVKNSTVLEFVFENYTALGYGDALPQNAPRLIGPVVSLNGVLLIGWSVAIIFEVMRMAELQFGRRDR
jgi:Ion channel